MNLDAVCVHDHGRAAYLYMMRKFATIRVAFVVVYDLILQFSLTEKKLKCFVDYLWNISQIIGFLILWRWMVIELLEKIYFLQNIIYAYSIIFQIK